MSNNKWYWLQAFLQTGIPQEELQEALLLYEEKLKLNPNTQNLMFECLEEIGLSRQILKKARLNYLRLLESLSLSGNLSP